MALCLKVQFFLANPVYIYTQSSHPPNNTKQPPTMIKKKLSSIACDEDKFDKVALTYNQPLAKCKAKYNLVFNPTTMLNQKTGKTTFNPQPHLTNVFSPT